MFFCDKRRKNIQQPRKKTSKCAFVQTLLKQWEKREKKRKENLHAEQAALQSELANLKGFFSGKRRKEIEARLAEIDAELKKL